MTEILFIVEDAAEGGYTARAVGTSISPTRTTWISSAMPCVMQCAAISRTLIGRKRSGATWYSTESSRRKRFVFHAIFPAAT